MSLSRRGTLTLVPSILVIVALAGAATAQPPAASTAAALTPDDLLAAVDWRTLQELAGGPAWWPDFPQFNVGVGDRAPGLRFYVVQTLVRVAASTPQRLEATALLYADARAARDDFRRRLLEQNDRGADMVQGPSLGAAARYFTRRRTSGDLRAETTLRFVAGPFVARVSHVTAGEQEALSARVTQLHRMGAAIEEGLRALQAGRLRAAPLPARLASMLPPTPVAAGVGPVRGTAVLPPHAWALADTAKDPVRVLAALQRGGVDEVTMRRYGLRVDPTHVVEATYMFFATPEHTAEWVEAFRTEVRQQHSLHPGAVGRSAAFTRYPDGGYELQFAKGQAVGDVLCHAPFGQTTAVCAVPPAPWPRAGTLPCRRPGSVPGRPVWGMGGMVSCGRCWGSRLWSSWSRSPPSGRRPCNPTGMPPGCSRSSTPRDGVEKRSGVTAFTPGDGLTFFSILPTIKLEGRVVVETLFQSLVVDEFGTLPGYRVLSRRVRPASDASGASSIEATWEWTYPESRTPKRAWILIGAQPVPGAQHTAAGFVMYESPTREWQRVEPLFKQMLQSLRFSRS